MASTEVDPLANTDEIQDNFNKINPNLAMLTENDINLIKKMQYLSSLAPQPMQPKLNGRNSSLVTNKSLPDILCTCPQKCDEKIPLKVRTYMFKYYHALCRDRSKQEALLLRFIEMKSLAQRLKEDNKRVQCRYKGPTNMKAIQFIFEDDSVTLSDDDSNENEPKQKRAKLDLDKEEPASPNLNDMTVLKSDPSIQYRIDKNGYTEVCQKAYMNVFLVPEKRVRAVREKLVASKRIIIEKEMAQAQVMNSELETAVKIAQDLAAGCKPLLQMLQQQHPNKISDEDDKFDISGQLLNAIDSDIELVNNFFYNQLWKPEIFEGFVSPKDVAPAKNLLNGTHNGTFDSSLNSTAKSVGTMNSALLDETFDSVINASARDSDMNMTAPEESIQESTINESTINEETDNDPLDDTQEDPLENDPLESPASAEDLEVQAASENTPLSNGDMPLNLNINGGGATSPDSISSRTSPDSTVSRNSSSTTTSNSAGLAKPLNLATENGAAMDLSTSSPHRSSSSSSSSKSRSSHHNGSHRSEPMRNSSRSSSSTSSIQNILNNHQAAVAAAAAAGNFFMPPLMPSPLFDPDLTKYLSGLESSISITPKMSNGRERGSSSGGSRRSRNNGNGNYANGANSQATAAALTAQLIQNALAQTSISVTATTGGGSSSSRYNQHSSAMSSLNQILNIPDSVSITPTLVDKSKS